MLKLLVSERYDWIDFGCAARGKVAGNQSHRDEQHQYGHHRQRVGRTYSVELIFRFWGRNTYLEQNKYHVPRF